MTAKSGDGSIILIKGATGRRLALFQISNYKNNRSVWQDNGRLFLCLGIMLAKHVTKAKESRIQCKKEELNEG